jgi:hypothetical protein
LGGSGSGCGSGCGGGSGSGCGSGGGCGGGSGCRGGGGCRGGAAVLGLLDQARDVLAGLAEDGDRRAELDGVALLDQELQQHALVLEGEVHVGLVGLDLGDEVSGRHLVALLLDPPHQHALFHGRGQLRQSDDLRHLVFLTRGRARA